MKNMERFPKLPLKFFLLWILNLAVILTIVLTTGFDETLSYYIRGSKNLVFTYCAAGAVPAYLEYALWEKLKGN